MNDLALLAGRVLFGGMFVYNGLNHFRNRKAIIAYATYKKVPMPDVTITLTALWLLAGGLSIVLGARPRVGAAMVALFLLVVTPKMHDYWNVADPQQQLGEWINFQKNVAMIGAALMMLALPLPWPYSLGF
ncbi:MAG: DoxX family protein [Acidobacteria bacterium]|nr:DoxX family protein [Acidobacteriota bacterium]